MEHEKLVGLLCEAASRIRDIESAAIAICPGAKDNDDREETLAIRIEDAAALAQDIEGALVDER